MAPISPSLVDESKITTEKCDSDHGSLVTGDEIDVYDRKHIGFILQYFSVGLIYGGLPATIYGVFLGYLNVPAYVYATTGVITTLPWSFKFLFGMLNDCVPLFGYRRKPYMAIGWSLCCAMLVVLYFCKLPAPFFCVDPRTGYYIKLDALGNVAKPCNKRASEEGGKYAMLMCLAALGYVVADVAADGM